MFQLLAKHTADFTALQTQHEVCRHRKCIQPIHQCLDAASSDAAYNVNKAVHESQ